MVYTFAGVWLSRRENKLDIFAGVWTLCTVYFRDKFFNATKLICLRTALSRVNCEAVTWISCWRDTVEDKTKRRAVEDDEREREDCTSQGQEQGRARRCCRYRNHDWLIVRPCCATFESTSVSSQPRNDSTSGAAAVKECTHWVVYGGLCQLLLEANLLGTPWQSATENSEVCCVVHDQYESTIDK